MFDFVAIRLLFVIVWLFALLLALVFGFHVWVLLVGIWVGMVDCLCVVVLRLVCSYLIACFATCFGVWFLCGTLFV